MSGRIGAKKLKFVVFGSGNDYARLDSGPGASEVQIFSHGSVPLGSQTYLGQYFLEVPDADGVLFDAIKDDLEHCTITPELGTVFDAEGDVEVGISYYREYIVHETEEIITVSRNYTQTVHVVDHGSVVTSAVRETMRAGYGDDIVLLPDIYSDGYAFFRPLLVDSLDSTITGVMMHNLNNSSAVVTSVSSVPWRIEKLGIGSLAYTTDYGWMPGFFLYSNYTRSGGAMSEESYHFNSIFMDTADLEMLPLKHVRSISGLFVGATDLCSVDGIAEWSVSGVGGFSFILANPNEVGAGRDDLSCLASWDISGGTSFVNMFRGVGSSGVDLSPLDGWEFNSGANLSGMLSGVTFGDATALASWRVGGVATLDSMFESSNIGASAAPLSLLSGWDVSSVSSMAGMFAECAGITALDALSGWVTSALQATREMFHGCTHLVDISGLSGWNTGALRSINSMFYGCSALVEVDALSGWDVSRCTSLSFLFYMCSSLTDISGLADWDVSAVTDMSYMFDTCTLLPSIAALANWDVSHVVYMGSMFHLCYWLVGALTVVQGWVLTALTDCRSMFSGCPWLNSFAGIVLSFTNNVSMREMFYITNNNRGLVDSSSKRWVQVGTEYMDSDGNTVASVVGAVYLAYDASGAAGWSVVGSRKGAFNTDSASPWVNIPTWN